MKTKFKLQFKVGKTFKDKRGWLKKILDGNFSSCIEVYSKKGSVRANHYHKKDKHFIYVINGEILYFYRNRKKIAKTRFKIMKKNDLFFTPAMQEHMAQMQRSASDPDRASPTRQMGTIPSQDISAGDMGPYDAGIEPKGQEDRPSAHEPHLEHMKKKRVTFDPRTSGKTPSPFQGRDPDMLNLRGGVGSPFGRTPEYTGMRHEATEEGGMEDAGPNNQVPRAEILMDMGKIRKQIQWLANNPHYQGNEEVRNITQLAQSYQDLGGDMNAVMQEAGGSRGRRRSSPSIPPIGGAEELSDISPPPTKPRVRRSRGRGRAQEATVNPSALLQQMLQHAGSGVAPPRVITQTQTVPIPIPIPTGAAPQKKQPSGIVVKQTVKQEQKASVQKNRRIRKIQKGSITKARKAYNALKKQIKAALTKDKKSEYTRENDKIKKLPAKSRKAARAKLRVEIKAKLQKLLKFAKPSKAYKTIEAINRAIAQLKKLKW